MPRPNQQMKPRPEKRLNNIDILEHQGLVRIVIKKFRWVERGKNLDQDDLFQAGMIGLMRSVETFDESRGIKFSTYATWWIKHFVRRLGHDESRTVRFPAWYQDELKKVGITIPLVTKSLDAPLPGAGDDSNSTTMLDMMPDTESLPDADDGPICIQQRKKYAHYLLSTLTDKERVVMTLRLHGHTLEQVGDQFGFTRERARQIEANALWKLQRKVTDKDRREYAP